MSYGFGLDIFSILFTLAFVLIFGMILVTVFRSISQWNKNNHAPRLTVDAKIVSRRSSHHRHDNTSSTSYYVTFEFQSGDRLELHVPSREFGYLVEGDQGQLTFQGTRFLSFQRR